MSTKEQRLKKKLEDRKKQLLSISTDHKFASELIENMLILQKQMDIKPSYITVNTDEICKDDDGNNMEYTFGAFRIVKTRQCILLSCNGYDVAVRPWLKSLYGQLNTLIEILKMGELPSDEESTMYKNYLDATMNIMSYPLICFIDETWIETATFIVKQTNTIFEKVENSLLQDEDVIANENFKDDVLLSEEIKQSLKKEE